MLYQRGVAALVPQGWLSQDQGAILIRLADGL